MLNVRREGSRKSEAGSSPRLKKMKSSKKCLMLIGMKAVVPSGKAPSSELHSKGLKGSFGSDGNHHQQKADVDVIEGRG